MEQDLGVGTMVGWGLDGDKIHGTIWFMQYWTNVSFELVIGHWNVDSYIVFFGSSVGHCFKAL